MLKNNITLKNVTRFSCFAISVLCLLSPVSAMAELRTVKPIERPLLLSGRGGSASFAFELETSALNPHTPKLHLAWVISDVVNKERSSLTIQIDRRPLRTFWISKISQPENMGVSVVDMGSLEAGVHVVTVISRLVVEDDPCLMKYQNDAWLHVLPETKIEWTKQAEKKARLSNVATIKQVWKGKQEKPFIQISPPLLLNKETALATILADHLLRKWNFVPTLKKTKGGSRLLLRLLPPPEGLPVEKNKLFSLLANAPAEARAVVSASGQTMTVLARTDKDLKGAVEQLFQDRIRNLCPTRKPCFLGETILSEAQIQNQEKENEAQVLSLTDIGYKHGWETKGAGTHILRFVWNKPAWWKISKFPELHLHVRVPKREIFNPKTTSLTIRLNERPLASWNLENYHQEQAFLKVKIPKEFWKENTWSFEVLVHLRPTEKIPCESLDENALWLVVESGSQLLVERDEAIYEGIASFFKMAETKRPLLVWSENLEWNQIIQFSHLLYPFYKQTPFDKWQWVDILGKGNDQYIVPLKPGITPKAPLTRLTHHGESWWIDESKKLGIPFVETRHTARLSYVHSDDQGVTFLEMNCGTMSNQEQIETPPYSALLGRHALWANQRWFSLGQDKTPFTNHLVQKTKEADAKIRLKSEQEKALRWVNIIWGMVVLGILLRLADLLA